MSNMISKSKYPYVMDNQTGDLYYGDDQEIMEDSIGYYQERERLGIFYNRTLEEVTPLEITEEEKEHLLTIQEILQKHNTDFKIIISPKYDQISIDPQQLNLLNTLFEKENVYDFSGKNEWTEPIGNFYEPFHFRPMVAKEIMVAIYSE